MRRDPVLGMSSPTGLDGVDIEFTRARDYQICRVCAAVTVAFGLVEARGRFRLTARSAGSAGCSVVTSADDHVFVCGGQGTKSHRTPREGRAAAAG
jgi:hypothetical protein